MVKIAPVDRSDFISYKFLVKRPGQFAQFKKIEAWLQLCKPNHNFCIYGFNYLLQMGRASTFSLMEFAGYRISGRLSVCNLFYKKYVKLTHVSESTVILTEHPLKQQLTSAAYNFHFLVVY